jgi:hypothetical protein
MTEETTGIADVDVKSYDNGRIGRKYEEMSRLPITAIPFPEQYITVLPDEEINDEDQGPPDWSLNYQADGDDASME